MKHILRAGGGKMEDVVKTTILLKDINDFGKVNEIYSQCIYIASNVTHLAFLK